MIGAQSHATASASNVVCGMAEHRNSTSRYFTQGLSSLKLSAVIQVKIIGLE